ELRALLEAPLGLRGRAEASGQPDLAEGTEARAGRSASRGRGNGEADSEVGAWLVDADAAGDIDEHVGLPEGHARVAGEDGDEHREALRVDAGADPTGHGQVGRRDERLDFEQDRASAFERARNRGADLAGSALAEELRGIGYPGQPGARHLEHAQLV